MQRRYRFDIKWISAVLFIVAGTIVALKAPYFEYGFPCFVVAHMILLYDFSTTHKNVPLIMQNAYFMVINSIATYIWLIK